MTVEDPILTLFSHLSTTRASNLPPSRAGPVQPGSVYEIREVCQNLMRRSDQCWSVPSIPWFGLLRRRSVTVVLRPCSAIHAQRCQGQLHDRTFIRDQRLRSCRAKSESNLIGTLALDI